MFCTVYSESLYVNDLTYFWYKIGIYIGHLCFVHNSTKHKSKNTVYTGSQLLFHVLTIIIFVCAKHKRLYVDQFKFWKNMIEFNYICTKLVKSMSVQNIRQYFLKFMIFSVNRVCDIYTIYFQFIFTYTNWFFMYFYINLQFFEMYIFNTYFVNICKFALRNC